MRSRVSVWLRYPVAVCKFSGLVTFGTQKPTPASVRSTSVSSDDIKTTAGWCGFSSRYRSSYCPNLPTGWWQVAFATIKIFRRTTIDGSSQTRTRDLFTHNRCPHRHWCPHRTKWSLLKALHSPVHPNHLRLRVSSVIITSLQQKSRSMIYNLHFPTKIGIPEGRFCQISGHVVSQRCWKGYLHLGFYSVRRCKRCALHFPSFFYYKRSFYPREEVQAEFPMIWLLKKWRIAVQNTLQKNTLDLCNNSWKKLHNKIITIDPKYESGAFVNIA